MRNILHTVDTDWFHHRVVGVLLCVAAVFGVLFLRLFYLQVIDGREYRRLSESNSIRLQDIDAPRGLIFDRYSRMLVDNRPSFDLHIILKDAKPLNDTLSNLSRISGMALADLKARVESNKEHGAYKPVLLKEDIGRDVLAAIEVHKYDLPGVLVHISPRRHYLYQQQAAHLLGYMGEISPGELRKKVYADLKSGDFIGKYGLEKSSGPLLRGKRGGRQVEVNATGQVVRVIKTVNARPGKNIILTIDQNLQIKTEELLEGKAGAAVAIDPNNGEVLAMASSPAFDPNLFAVGMSRFQWDGLINNPYRPLENKAIQAEYPPASTYKIVTAIAGLGEGVIDEKTQFFCPGHYRYGNRVYRCWRRGGHGEMDVVSALTQSCDVYFYQVGEAVGVDILAKYAKACGLGELTGIGLGQEAKGLIPTSQWKLKRIGEPWQGGETLSIAIGQGFDLVTPLQMAVLAAAVGNGGTRYRPRLIQKVLTAENRTTYQGEPEVIGQLPLSAKTLEILRSGLWSVVNTQRGTAYGSRLKNIEYSGKTGTAQVVARPQDSAELDEELIKEMHKDHAWFVAYAPSRNPQIAIAVLVEHGEHGSSAAAPIAKQMIQSYLDTKSVDAMALLQTEREKEFDRTPTFAPANRGEIAIP